MKKLILFLILVFGYASVYAQKERENKQPCATDAIHFERMKDASYKQKFEIQNKEWQEYANKYSGSNKIVPPTPPFKITVAFHNMGNGTFQTVDYDGIVNYLNQVYQPANIQFCKALQDKNGDLYEPNQIGNLSVTNSTSGINTFLSSIITSNVVPTTGYLNFYIVDAIGTSLVNPTPVAGFAFMPSNHGEANDGVYVNRDQLTIPISSKTVAHEVGHYLGLFHVFGICNPNDIDDLNVYDANGNLIYNPCSCDNNNCIFNGDMVCDTPPSILDMTTCSSNSCHTDDIPYPAAGAGNINPLTGDLNDDKTNFMDYGGCGAFHFTPGQYLRVQFTMDPNHGPRKSLLLTQSCINCTELVGCDFSITPLNQNAAAPAIQNPALENVAFEGQSVSFVPVISCGTTATITYAWVLTNTDTHTVISQNSDGNFTMPNVSGNYSVSLTASVNTDCSETATYNFYVIPSPNLNSACIPFPESDSDTDWLSSGWNRVSYINGWNRDPLNPSQLLYAANGSIRYLNTDPIINTVNADGFQVLNSIPSTDVNFGTIPAFTSVSGNALPLMRVGVTIDPNSNVTTHNNGDAYYSSIVLHPTKAKCKFRIYYIGMAEFTNASPPINFHNSVAEISNDATFGFVNQYQFVNPLAGGQTAYFGTNETGLLSSNTTVDPVVFGPQSYSLGYNDFIYGISPNSLLINDNEIVNGHKRMKGWKYVDVDYSEFVNIAPTDLAVTLTFFARSNSGFDASKHAYAYFAVDCLGGGVPNNLTLDLPDLQLPCSPPDSENSCHTYTITLPDDLINPHTFGDFNSSGYNNLISFSVVPVATTSNATISYLPHIFGSPTYGFKICLSSSDVPSEDFQVTFSTINQTITQTIRVFYGYYYTLNCQRSDVPQVHAGTYDANFPIHEVAYCPRTLPGTGTLVNTTFTLTTPCIIPQNYDIVSPITMPDHLVEGIPYYYQWTVETVNQLGSTVSFPLSITTHNLNTFSINGYIPFANNCLYRIYRTLYVKDYYCGGYAPLKCLDYFYLYPVTSQPIITADPLNVCSNDTSIDVHVNAVDLTRCIVPETALNNYLTLHNITDASGTLTLEVLSPTNAHFSPPATLVIPIGADGLPVLTNAVLTFNNVNTHNTPDTADDTPYYTGNTTLHIAWTLVRYGCSVSGTNTSDVFINIESSAFGGSISEYTPLSNCPTFYFISPNIGVASSYTWEESQDGITWSTIVPGSSNSVLYNYQKHWPLTYIRRRANAISQTANCNQPAYSNVIILDPGMPLFNNWAYICENNPIRDLPSSSINGIDGTWVQLTPIGQCPEQWQFNPDSLNCVPLDYPNNPFIQTIECLPPNDPKCDCQNTLTLTAADDPVPPNALVYQRHEWIQVKDNFFVSDIDNVEMHAGNYIDLLPEDGSHFTEYRTQHHFMAYILDCEPLRIGGKAINDLKSKALWVVPNPTNGVAEIIMKDAKFNNVVISSMDGKTIFSKSIESNYSYQIDISRYPQGMYIVTVTADDGQIFNEKIIKN